MRLDRTHQEVTMSTSQTTATPAARGNPLETITKAIAAFNSHDADGYAATYAEDAVVVDDSWVEHPYCNGIVLIGDAAATSDPTWGQGLSLTLHDVRTLRDALLAQDDWDAAGQAYASAHARYYECVRTTNSWFTQIWLQPGPSADALRARVVPLLESDPLVLPDTMVAGPGLAPPTAAHQARIFGDLAAPAK
jgi:2-polyprenyl-6-methoxyphenol hydroxylase-like FAD-dependent oxidoreductase